MRPLGREGQRVVEKTKQLWAPPAETGSVKPEAWVAGMAVPGTRWTVQKRLGHGGMGIVFEVRKDPAGILGAMKVLRGPFAEKRSWVDRFLAEAQLLATVRHPNIV